MAKTVRDILVNVDSGDLLLYSGDTSSHLYFDIVWGQLFPSDAEEFVYANVIIPERRLDKLHADDDGRFLLYAKSTYKPDIRPVRIRLVLDRDGNRSKIDQNDCAFPVNSTAHYPHDKSGTVTAAEFQGIDISGHYLILFEFGQRENSAFVYTADSTDILIGDSNLQSSQLLSICEPGKFYRYPVTGVGVTSYIGSVVAHTELGNVITEQFSGNGVSVQDADFNAATGELQVIFFNEGISDDTNLMDAASLDLADTDILDEVLESMASEINLEDYDIDFGELPFGIIAPESTLESCFANGIWIGSMPWTGDLLWKGEE